MAELMLKVKKSDFVSQSILDDIKNQPDLKYIKFSNKLLLSQPESRLNIDEVIEMHEQVYFESINQDFNKLKHYINFAKDLKIN